jgi:hypothetical protein
MCEIRIQQDFIAKNKQKTKKHNDKKMHPKLVLNKLKVIRNLYHWALSSRRSLSKNFEPTCGPCPLICAHVHPYVPHVYPHVNYE